MKFFWKTAVMAAFVFSAAVSFGQLTPEQAISRRNISDIRFSPDGQQIAIAVTDPPKGNTRTTHIWMMDVTTHELRQFTNSTKSESSPRWSAHWAEEHWLRGS